MRRDRRPTSQNQGAGERRQPQQVDPGLVEYHLANILGGRAQITGRGRTPERNRQVGGAANSRHLADRARDFEIPGVTNRRRGQGGRRNIENWIRQQFAARGIQLHEAIDEGNHFHISW